MLNYQKKFMKYCISIIISGIVIYITMQVLKQNSFEKSRMDVILLLEGISLVAITGLVARDQQSILGSFLTLILQTALNLILSIAGCMFGAIWLLPLAIIGIILVIFVFYCVILIVAVAVPVDFLITLILFIIQCIIKRDFSERLTKALDFIPIIMAVLFWIAVFNPKIYQALF